MPEPKKPRVSLTAKQAMAGVGAELLALCQAVTEDGKLSPEEIREIVGWVHANRDSDLPAIGFLVGTVERIVADGRVTAEERAELHRAIEAVLPPEARKAASGRRREVEARKRAIRAEAAAREKAGAREARAAERERARAERERKRPIHTADFMVAGVLHEGRADAVRRHAAERDKVSLHREPGNPKSRNAIAIHLGNGMPIGYMPEADAREVAPLLDAGHPHRAVIKKILAGGRAPVPVVVAYVYRHGVKEDVPPPAPMPRAASPRPAAVERRASRSEEAGKPWWKFWG